MTLLDAAMALAFVVLCVETVWLLRRRLYAFLPTIGAGLAFLVALVGVTQGAGTTLPLVALAAAGLCHVADIAVRLRRVSARRSH